MMSMMRSKLKNKLAFATIGIITAIVLYFALKDDFEEIIHHILNINLVWLVVGILLMFLYLAAQASAIYELSRKFNKKYKFRRAFKLELGTHFFNYITPFASGGQPYQIYGLNRSGFRLIDATNIAIQGFITHQIALIIVSGIAVYSNYYFGIFNELGFLKELVLIGFIFNFIILIILLLISFGKTINSFIVVKVINGLSRLNLIKNKEDYLVKWSMTSAKFHSGASLLFKDKTLFIRIVSMKILSLLVLYSIPVVILYSFSNYHDLTGFISIVSTAYIMLIGSFIPTPGGSGGLEYGFVQFFGIFISGGVLTSAMLIWRFITFYLILIIGVFALNIKRGSDV